MAPKPLRYSIEVRSSRGTTLRAESAVDGELDLLATVTPAQLTDALLSLLDQPTPGGTTLTIAGEPVAGVIIEDTDTRLVVDVPYDQDDEEWLSSTGVIGKADVRLKRKRVGTLTTVAPNRRAQTIRLTITKYKAR